MNSPNDGTCASVRILITDDHPLVRMGLRARLSLVDGFAVVAEAAEAEQAIALLEAHTPDILLTDLSLPGMGGIELIRHTQTHHPRTVSLVVSMFNSREYILASLRAGARGYILKEAPIDEIVSAIHAALAGGTYYSQEVASLALGIPAKDPHLTSRELEVLLLLAKGCSNKKIANQLGISVRTVETHRLSLRRKLGVDSPAELLKMAVQYGWAKL
jgi:two-component system nitrate/nitrite response regulator NarL